MSALYPTSLRLAVDASGIDFFYGLRPIDLPRAWRVLIEESSRNKKGEAESHPRVATHTEKRERPEASEKVLRSGRDAHIYRPLSDSRLLINYAFNILSEEPSLMCLIKAFPWGSTLIMFLIK